MFSCCKLLGVRSFILEVKSWSDHYLPVNLYQMNVILYPDKKGPGSKAQLMPSEVHVLTERRQISAGGGALRARIPDPVQVSSLREPGAQPNWPSGSSSHLYGRGQFLQTVTQPDCHCYQAAETKMGRGSPLPQGLGRASGGFDEGSGALQDAAPSLLPRPPSSSGLRPVSESGGPREKARFHPLTSLSA